MIINVWKFHLFVNLEAQLWQLLHNESCLNRPDDYFKIVARNSIFCVKFSISNTKLFEPFHKNCYEIGITVTYRPPQ